MTLLPKKTKSQLGQTLIETMAAVFILTMGVTASVGLAVYAFSASTLVTKQIIGTGLAREGIEAVRNMRDTNWLQQTSLDNCYDFTSSPIGQLTAKCYSHWMGNGGPPYYCINPTNNSGLGSCNGNGDTLDYYILGFDSTNSGTGFWSLQKQDTQGNNVGKYGLDFDPNGSSGFYVPGSNQNGSSAYYRKITITKLGDGPNFNQAGLGPKLFVQSQVWWTDKKCPRVVDYPGPGKCSTELDMFLTNWKNYQ